MLIGFTQILLTYTLSAVASLLGFSTLWLGCGTLARDIEECQMQMVAVKPVPRWQIWLGKWLGIMALNVLLLGASGGAIFLLLQWRAQQLPPDQQKMLRDEVLVARGSARETIPDLEPVVALRLAERLKQASVAEMDLEFVRKQIREQIKAEYQLVAPGSYRVWRINLGLAQNWLRDQPLFLRIKFNAAQKSASGTFTALWQVGPPETQGVWRNKMSLAPDTFHEFQVPKNLYDEKGVLTIFFINPNDTALLFSPEEGLEVLYREGSFGLNFVRGLGIILCWLALLAALGLAAASFLSFPVAAFFSLALLIISFSSGTMAQVVEEGGVSGVNHDTGKIDDPRWIDTAAVPLFRVALKLLHLVQGFSPIDSLSTGRSISWTELAMAWIQIGLMFGGILGTIGVLIFTRRELATAQSHQ